MNERYWNNLFLRTTDLHDHFNNRTVFVAGDTGFYGSWLAGYFTYLKSKGVMVEVQGGSRASGWDITDLNTYTNFQRNASFVINCAGSSEGNDLSAHQGRFVHQLYSLSHEKCRFLHVSSGAAGKSKTPYALAKQDTEKWLAGCEVKIVRPFATVGPGMGLDRPFAVSTFIKRKLAGEPLEVAKQPITRSFCHITDLLVQMLYVLVHGETQIPYEVGSDDGITIEAAARLISKDVVVVDKPFPSNAASLNYVANVTRLKKQYNLALDYTSEKAILDTLHFYEAEAAQTNAT